MLVYSLSDNNIQGENFRGFLLYCLEISTYFSITIVNPQIKLSEFNKFLSKSFHTYSWYCYKTYEKPLSIMLYHSTPLLLAEIIKYFDCLFPENTKGIEDICFFNDTEIMFGSVTHEGIAQLVLSSETDIKSYRKFAKWEKEIITDKDYDFFPNLKKLT